MTLDEVRRFALALPESTESPHFDFTSFRVAGKIFLTAPPDGEHLHCFVGEQERELALATAPECCLPLHWGTGVVGLRVHLACAPDDDVKHWISKAWLHKAPKRLRPHP